MKCLYYSGVQKLGLVLIFGYKGGMGLGSRASQPWSSSISMTDSLISFVLQSCPHCQQNGCSMLQIVLV